ncbi:MAG: hypothetical protein J6W04_04265 [Bacteroidales bacterium]|nr:hypothetical protein [Bacteroidales bacterium]
MGGSASYREGKKTQQTARNAINEFLDEHSFNGRGGIYEGYAYEYIAGIAEATKALDHNMVVTINRTARAEYGGSGNVFPAYDEMRKALTKMRRHPRMLKKLLAEYGISVQSSKITDGVMDLTITFTDRDGNKQTQTGRFDPELSRFPGLDVRW